MKRPINKKLTLSTYLFLILVIAGCAPFSEREAGDSQKAKLVRKDWFYPTRQKAAEPIYNRIRAVRPPEPIVAPPVSVNNAPILMPVMKVDLPRMTIKEIAEVIAKAYRYDWYCSPLIADRQLTVNGLGTLDEIASVISNKSGFDVLVDHQNREFRIIPGDLIKSNSSDGDQLNWEQDYGTKLEHNR